MTQCSLATGIRLTTMNKICSTLILPPVRGIDTSNEYIKKFPWSSIEEAEKLLQQSAQNAKTCLRQKGADFTEKNINDHSIDCIYDRSTPVDKPGRSNTSFHPYLVLYI